MTGFSFAFGCLAAITMGTLASAARADASEPLMAIDVLVEPDATMIAAAQAVNARLREAYPAGYSLDESRAPTSRCSSAISASRTWTA